MKLRDGFFLLLLTAGAFFLHGYHPYTEDAAIYVPAIEKALQPALFPHGAEFFESHGGLTLFPQLIAASARVLHLPLETVLLLWHVLCLFLFLLGCWQVARACFEAPEARWASVGLVAALLTLPAGASAMLLMDEYVGPRSFSSVGCMFAVALALRERYLAAVLLLAASGLIHPMMPVYALFFVLLLLWNRRRESHAPALAALLPFENLFQAPTPAYHQAALHHSFHYIWRWAWYEWAGVFGPIALFVWFGRVARRRGMSHVARLCSALVPFLWCALGAAVVLDTPARFEALARFQPMRSLHLAYILMFLLLGGMLGQFVLRRAVWRWMLLFIPVCAGAAVIQFWMYPASAHVEWPGAPSRNEWVQAFRWVRANTPQDAYFALDPDYLDRPGEDRDSFRAIAERSSLAELVKDSGAVSMFPSLAEEWWEQVEAEKGWGSFQAADFQRLQQRYGVNWVVLQQPGAAGLACPYQNHSVRVCRVE